MTSSESYGCCFSLFFNLCVYGGIVMWSCKHATNCIVCTALYIQVSIYWKSSVHFSRLLLSACHIFVASPIHSAVLTCINVCCVVYVLRATVQRLIKCIQCCVAQRRQATQLDTHQVLFRLSVQYQAILLGYGNSPSLTVKLLPPYSPVSLKSASPTEAECVGELLFGLFVLIFEV